MKMWKITCYNGTVWSSKGHACNISDVINEFKAQTGLHEMDIKKIENEH
jgi:hypothetical protein